MRPKTVSCDFLWKYSFFRKNCRTKNIQHQMSDKKGHIHFWCTITPDRSHSDTVGRVANKVRIEWGFAPFNPYFYVPKYHSSDALPASEFFFFKFSTKHFFPKILKIIAFQIYSNFFLRLPIRMKQKFQVQSYNT